MDSTPPHEVLISFKSYRKGIDLFVESITICSSSWSEIEELFMEELGIRVVGDKRIVDDMYIHFLVVDPKRFVMYRLKYGV